MSEKRIEPELPIDEHNGLEFADKPEPINRFTEVVLTQVKKHKTKGRWIVNLGFSELNKIVIEMESKLKAINGDIDKVKEEAEQKAVEACNHLSGEEFDKCVKSKKVIHEKHTGLDELEIRKAEIEKEIENELPEKLLNKLRELRK